MNPRKPIRSHFHSNKIFKRKMAAETANVRDLPNQSFASLKSSWTFKRLKMERILRSCYDVKRRAASNESLFGRFIVNGQWNRIFRITYYHVLFYEYSTDVSNIGLPHVLFMWILDSWKLKKRMHELFASAENILLTCVLLHKYPLVTDESKGNCYRRKKNTL